VMSKGSVLVVGDNPLPRATAVASPIGRRFERREWPEWAYSVEKHLYCGGAVPLIHSC
jgi:hypothetical protein